MRVEEWEGRQGPGDQEAEEREAGSWEMSHPGPLVLWGLKEKAFKGDDTLELSTTTFNLSPCRASHLQRESHISVATGLASSMTFFLRPFLYFLLGFPWFLQQQVLRGIQERERMCSFVLKERDGPRGVAQLALGLLSSCKAPSLIPVW